MTTANTGSIKPTLTTVKAQPVAPPPVSLSPASSQAVAPIAIDAVTFVKTVVDSLFGEVETELPAIEGDSAVAAENYVEAILPAWGKLVFSGIIATSNLATHAGLLASLTAGQIAALKALQPRIDSDLQALQNKYAPPVAAPASSTTTEPAANAENS